MPKHVATSIAIHEGVVFSGVAVEVGIKRPFALQQCVLNHLLRVVDGGVTLLDGTCHCRFKSHLQRTPIISGHYAVRIQHWYDLEDEPSASRTAHRMLSLKENGQQPLHTPRCLRFAWVHSAGEDDSWSRWSQGFRNL